MKLLNVACAGVFLAGIAALATRAGEGSEREELRKSLKDVEIGGSWIYDDISAGFAAARKAGKPLLVVFR